MKQKGMGARMAGFMGASIALLGSVFVIRVVVDTSFRMVYPFVPQLSDGLKLSIQTFSWLLSVRATSGLLGPVFGSLADRYGRRVVMTGALLVQSLGLAGMAFSSGWWGVLPMFLVGLATNGFVPAQQAYISDQVPFERRGRALGVVEASFAVAGIALLPLVGWILEGWGWQVPFFLLGMLSLVAAGALWMGLPETESRTAGTDKSSSAWRLVRKSNVLAVVGVALFTFISVGMFMTFWGIWVNQDYGLGAAEVGLLATVIGVAELSGAVGSGLFIDRIGKRRGNLLGLLGAAVMFGLIPVFGKTIATVRVALVLTVLMIEFTIVSLFPLYGEQAPEARATVFSLGAFGTAVGFMIGPPLATSLWDWGGVAPIAVVGAASLLVALGLVWGFLFDDGGRVD